MAIRGYDPEASMVFIGGAGGSGLLPPVILPPAAGDQPTNDKAIGLPATLGFHVEHGEQPIDVFGVGA